MTDVKLISMSKKNKNNLQIHGHTNLVWPLIPYLSINMCDSLLNNALLVKISMFFDGLKKKRFEGWPMPSPAISPQWEGDATEETNLDPLACKLDVYTYVIYIYI